MEAPQAQIDAVPTGVAVQTMIDEGDAMGVSTFFDLLDASDTTLVLARLSPDRRATLLAMLDAPRSARLIGLMPEPHRVEALNALGPETSAELLRAMPSDVRADLLGALDQDAATAILDELTRDEAEEARTLVEYDNDCAGGLMVTEYLSYRAAMTVQDVVDDLEKNAKRYARFDVQYMYVVDRTGVLIGVLRIRDLLLSDHTSTLISIMIVPPVSVRDDAGLSTLVSFFERHAFFGVPVIDDRDRLVGVVKRSAIESAVAQRNEKAYRLTQGIIGGEELRSMPLTVRSKRRLTWLSINVALNLVAATVIAAHQDTLEAVIALAVFLPIISDMSGCAGAQAVAVSTRELILGVTKPTELARSVLGEVRLGVINGAVVGLIIGLAAGLWQGNAWLGVVVGAAVALNTLLSVCIGGATPLLLKRMKIDPALASGPILTTVTDVSGFFIVLTLASTALDRIA
ncbi:MAG: magnesium transporter [Planctomycetota bacterium]